MKKFYNSKPYCYICAWKEEKLAKILDLCYNIATNLEGENNEKNNFKNK